jgi:hypothetical protein
MAIGDAGDDLTEVFRCFNLLELSPFDEIVEQLPAFDVL